MGSGMATNPDGSFRALTWSGISGLLNNRLEWIAHQAAHEDPGTLVEYLQLGHEGKEAHWYVVIAN